MTSPSSTAGKPCVECGIPDPCIFDVISDFPEAGEKHFWSKEGVARFKLLDDGSGCDGIITITYQCDKSGTHEAWLEEESENNHKILQPFEYHGIIWGQYPLHLRIIMNLPIIQSELTVVTNVAIMLKLMFILQWKLGLLQGSAMRFRHQNRREQ